MDAKQIETLMSTLRAGGQVDLTLSGNGVRSSKDCIPTLDDQGQITVISVFHNISDAWSYFSEAEFRKVLEGTRDIWDGDLDEQYRDSEDEGYPEEDELEVRQFTDPCSVEGCPNTATHKFRGVFYCEEDYLENENDPERL